MYLVISFKDNPSLIMDNGIFLLKNTAFLVLLVEYVQANYLPFGEKMFHVVYFVFLH